MNTSTLAPNTEIVLRDSNGNVKPLFNANVLGKVTGLQIPGITGSFKNSLLSHNLITNVGHAAANGRMSNQGSYSTFVNIAIGTGTTAAAATDTTLGAEITGAGGGARGLATGISQVTTTVTGDTTQLVKTFSFTASYAITEEGIFDAASTGGNLLAHQVFSVINVNSGDSLTITHKYQS
jgi:hypothetical protein